MWLQIQIPHHLLSALGYCLFIIDFWLSRGEQPPAHLPESLSSTNSYGILRYKEHPLCRPNALFFQFYRPQPHRHHLPFCRTIASRPEHPYAGRRFVFAVLPTTTAPWLISLFRTSVVSHQKILYLEIKKMNPTLISPHKAVLVLNFVRPSPRYAYQIQRRIMQ